MYKFIKTPIDDKDPVRIEMCVNNPHLPWPELMDEFVRFLQACGFIIPSDWANHLAE